MKIQKTKRQASGNEKRSARAQGRNEMTKINYSVYRPALERIRELADKGQTVIAAVDGRCGSGKSTLGQWLEEQLDCNLFHMDDFYLPFGERISGWEKTASANMDLDRFRRQVLLPVREGAAVDYQAYNAHKDLYSRTRIAPKQINIVEGSYSHHPAIRDLYDLTIFLTCGPEEQERRLRAREGDHFESYRTRWIPLEESYFAGYRTEENSGLVICTDPGRQSL